MPSDANSSTNASAEKDFNKACRNLAAFTLAASGLMAVAAFIAKKTLEQPEEIRPGINGSMLGASSNHAVGTYLAFVVGSAACLLVIPCFAEAKNAQEAWRRMQGSADYEIPMHNATASSSQGTANSNDRISTAAARNTDDPLQLQGVIVTPPEPARTRSNRMGGRG